MTELDPKAAAERLTHFAAGHPRAYETQPHGRFDKPLKADIRTLLKALAASQQQGPEIKGLEPSLAYQLAEEATCDCGAGHGALEPHISTCAWQTSQWKAWGDAFNAYPEMSEAFSHAYYLITGKSPQWGPAFGINEALREIDDAQRVLRLSIKSAPSVGAEEPTVDALRHDCAKAGPCSDMHDGCSCSDAELLARAPSPHKGEPEDDGKPLPYAWAWWGKDEASMWPVWSIGATRPTEAPLDAIALYAIPQAPIPEGMVRAAFNSAINFALDKLSGSESADFLRAWREGDTSEWPEFAATPAPQAEPGAGE